DWLSWSVSNSAVVSSHVVWRFIICQPPQTFRSPRSWTVGQLQRRDSLEEIREMLKPPRPPPGYYCHVCFSTEHYINYCPVGLNVDCKTPYKGHKKSIGLFVCPKCKRRWTSNNSYAGMSEKCSNCHCDTFPKKQVVIHFSVGTHLPVLHSHEPTFCPPARLCDKFLKISEFVQRQPLRSN
ncbi:Zinc knuckle family protein, partial [Trichuris trichiura]